MNLNFAPHIGLNSPEDGMFPFHASPDPVDQIAFIKERGFAGVEDNFFKARPPEQQKAIGKALKKNELKMGAMVSILNFDAPTIVSRSPQSIKIIREEMKTAIEAAKIAGATVLTLVSGIDDRSLPGEIKSINMIENLRWIGDLVERENMTIGVEAINYRNWAPIYLNSTRQASQLVTAVNHPNVRLIYDVFQAQTVDGDLLRGLEEAWDKIALIQLADAPHRTEPGSGEINFRNILQYIYDRGFEGLVELEHSHSISGIEGERRSLQIWDTLDQAIKN